MCRKRAFRQGQALRAASRALDVQALASGLRYSRATDEEACGAGSVKGSSQDKMQQYTKWSRHSTSPCRDSAGRNCFRQKGGQQTQERAERAYHSKADLQG